MTEKQREVLDTIHNLICEHFDGGVYVVDIALDHDNGDHTTAGGYNGGIAMASGLLQTQLWTLENKFHSSNGNINEDRDWKDQE